MLDKISYLIDRKLGEYDHFWGSIITLDGPLNTFWSASDFACSSLNSTFKSFSQSMVKDTYIYDRSSGASTSSWRPAIRACLTFSS